MTERMTFVSIMTSGCSVMTRFQLVEERMVLSLYRKKA
jgi:hypothetical protein